MDRSTALRQALDLAGISQSELARRSGVPQSRISEYINNRFEPSTTTFDTLMSALGMSVMTTIVPTGMERTKLRSWMLHRQIALKTQHGLSQEQWLKIRKNVERVRSITHGDLFMPYLDRWAGIAEACNTRELRRVLLDTSDDGITMREVSPMTGFLTDDERRAIIAQVPRTPA